MQNINCYKQGVGSLIIIGMSVLVSASSWAYDVQVATRAIENKLNSDDGFYIKYVPTHGFKEEFMSSVDSKSVTFNIDEMLETIEIKIGFIRDNNEVDEYKYTSLDPLFLANTNPTTCECYTVELYVTAHLIWVEADYSNPIALDGGYFAKQHASTVFFFGPGDVFTRNIMTIYQDDVRYFNEAELKNDVKNNYANNFSPMLEMHKNAVPLYFTF